MGGPPEDPVTIEFGRFKVVRHRRELLADGRPVELGGRAFDTLIALIDARGKVLDKDELMGRVWPDRVVEENNLAAQISMLRKVFGADRISSERWLGAAISSRVRFAQRRPQPLVLRRRG